jgi:hypothetical protein
MSTTNAFWAFGGGHLVAYDLAGVPLRGCSADDAIGPILAEILNLLPDLSRALLP